MTNTRIIRELEGSSNPNYYFMRKTFIMRLNHLYNLWCVIRDHRAEEAILGENAYETSVVLENLGNIIHNLERNN